MKLRCPRCLVGGYNETKAIDGRPLFTCSRCDYEWTCGHSGGKWKKADEQERSE